MQRKIPQFVRLLLIALIFGIAQNMNAQIKDGEATVYVGETVEVSIGSAYQSTLSRATEITYNWTCQSGGSFKILSSTRNYAIIEGITATTSGKLYYQCSYKYNGFFRTMNFYYDIVVKNNTVYVTKVEVTPSSATMKVGTRLLLTDKIYPTNATNQAVTWRSSSPNVAQVWESGLVEATSPGTTTITCYATDGSNKSATCNITVVPAEPTAVFITTEETTIEVGDTLKLDYSITPAGVATDIEWTSDNTAVAIVSDEGVVAAVATGEANITVSTPNGLSDTIHVTVTKTPTTEVAPVNGKFEVDGIYYNITDSVAKTVEVTFKGSDGGEYNEYTDSIVIPGAVRCAGITYSVTAIGNYAFDECDSLIAVSIPNEVTRIGFRAFSDCSSLRSVVMSENVDFVGSDAFAICSSLIEINLPNRVNYIGDYAFYYCRNLKSIIIPDSVIWIGISTFNHCTSLTSVVISNSVKTIGGDAFRSCVSLESIEIPNSVTAIESYAFYGCENLKSIILPDSIKEVSACLFHNCYDLTSVIIPGSVNAIHSRAFLGCHLLTSITSLNPTPPNCVDVNCFDYVPTTCVLKVPAGSKDLYAVAEGWCQFTRIVELSEDAGVEEISQEDKATVIARYDIHGRLLEQPTKGINIIIYSDGTTRKEIVAD